MRLTLSVLVSLFIAFAASATQPPKPGGSDGTTEAIGPGGVDLTHFTFRRALMPLMDSIQRNRALSAVLQFNAAADANFELGPTAVTGERQVPVFLVKYKDTPSDPFPPANLQQELFSEEWPPNCNATNTCTGTMRQYYREISYGRFTVNGTVNDWTKLANNAAFYQGSDFVDADHKTRHCNGICNTNHVADLIRETLQAHPDFPWELLDNDGPDGIPNSGDDDGFVDFVAFVQPESGGECSDGNRSIWSHRYSLSLLSGSDFVTNRIGKNGTPIRIDDYVIMPALACDKHTMIQIGVFAHEFGHAFGLPDLYDTSGKTSGLGNWCLMAGGSWGGDGNSPDRPTHMNPWAKNYLGWVTYQQVNGDLPARVDAIENHPVALRMNISPTQYYIISNERRQGFDSRLPTEGLAVWKVNQSMVNAGLRNNTVNATANPGIQLIEADGLQRLSDPRFRGGDGDLFPGAKGVRLFDNHSTPQSIGRNALCDIGDPDDPMSSRMLISRGLCQGAPAVALMADPGAPPVVSLRNLLAASANAPAGQVRLVGKLENASANYFKPAERKLVFSDAAGNSVGVVLPQVLETPPPPPTNPQALTAPITAAAVLGKPVEVTGVLTRNAAGEAVLQVTSVKNQQ